MALNAPLDILLVRKLGLPGREELAIGAIASGSVRVLNEDIVRALNIPEELINVIAQRELQELERREHDYRGDRSAPDVRDRTVILIDDGLATGASMRAALLREVHAMDANLALYEMITLQEQVNRSTAPQLVAVALVAILGGLALLLAGVGLYGVLSYAVAQSTRELGLRMALGAPGGRVLRLILRRAARHERHAQALRHQSLDRLEGGQLEHDVHVGPQPRERLEDLLAVRGALVVREERLSVQLAHRHGGPAREPVPGRDQEGQVVGG